MNTYPGCRNLVIGQCTGYNRDCRQFYCAVHSADRLCYECAETKSKLEEYRYLAEELPKRVRELAKTDCEYQIRARKIKRWGVGLLMLTVLFGMLSLMVLALSTLAPIFLTRFIESLDEELAINIFVITVMSIGLLLGLAGPSFVIGIAAFVSSGKPSLRLYSKYYTNLVRETDAVKPGFREFVDAWNSARRKENREKALLTAAMVAGLFVAGAVEAVAGSSDDEQIRREVRREFDRRGAMNGGSMDTFTC